MFVASLHSSFFARIVVDDHKRSEMRSLPYGLSENVAHESHEWLGMPGRAGALTAHAATLAGVPPASLRHKTIQCGLKQALRKTGRPLMSIFQDIASCIGVWRYIATMWSNTLIISDVAQPILDHLSEKPTALKTFYSRVFVALKSAALNQQPRNDNPLISDAVAFLERFPEIRTWFAANMQPLDNGCYELIQNEVQDLSVSTREHVGQFDKRLAHHFKIVCLNVCTPLNIPYSGNRASVDRISERATAASMCRESELITALQRVHDAVGVLGQTAENVVRSKLNSEILEMREAMGTLLAEHTFTDKKGVVHRCTRLENMLRVGIQAVEVPLLLPHCIRLSRVQSAYFETVYGTDSVVILEDQTHDDIVEDVDDEAENETTTSNSSLPRFLTLGRDKWSRPRPFAALPFARLRASMVCFTHTQIMTLINHTSRKLKTELTPRLKTSLKRARDSDHPENEFNNADDLSSLYAELTRLKSESSKESMSYDFLNKLFDMKQFKGCPVNTQGPVCFRTDGVTLSMTWGCAGESTIASLYSSGVYLPPPDAPVDVGDPNVAAGLYRLCQSRNDVQPLPSNSENIDIVAIDPGKVKPMQVGVVPLDSQSGWCPGTRDDVKQWCVTKKEYLDKTGRTHSNNIESIRRNKNSAYTTAVARLRTCRKRTCDPGCLNVYVSTAMQHLPVMAEELTHIGRSLRRWVANRRRLSAFSRWIDRLFDRTTVRARKLKPVLEQVNPTPNTQMFKDSRLERRRVLRHGRRRVCVPFFGDGSFSACSKGSCPIAKKALLKLMGARGPGFYLDEFKTSQMCPCGTSQLQDDPDHCHSRFRCHQTLSTESDCPLGQPNGERLDRDVSAIWNMLHIAQNALHGLPWPEAMRRA